MFTKPLAAPTFKGLIDNYVREIAK